MTELRVPKCYSAEIELIDHRNVIFWPENEMTSYLVDMVDDTKSGCASFLSCTWRYYESGQTKSLQ